MSHVIEINDIWKRFVMRREKTGFKEFLLHLPTFTRRKDSSFFWALKGITFNVRQGECLGIIGRNGAGKSTLLSIILGSTCATRGNVRVMERITPLLGLGAGFHPDLTGRENMKISGVLLGLTIDEINESMENIISFSGIGQFIDMPIRTYSSGMNLRLAFSLAVHTKPKLLLIDEVLGVGDESFQEKSKNTLLGLIQEGVTTVFVSHRLSEIKRMCSRAIWLDEGEIKGEGNPAKIVKAYRRHLE
jgi:ABC-type polysaccharide/polyol phosphate transport system ATPase subunit